MRNTIYQSNFLTTRLIGALETNQKGRQTIELTKTMAVYEVNWTLSALALVSCVLIGTVAGNEEASAKLVRQLTNDDLGPVQVDVMLVNYPDQNVKVNDRAIREMTGLCKETLKNCSWQSFNRLKSMQKEFRDTVPKLSEYFGYCRSYKLKDYCRLHIEQVANDLEGNVVEEDGRLVDFILDYVRKDENWIGAEDEDDDEDKAVVAEAYFELLSFEFGNEGLSKDEEKEFRHKIEMILNYLNHVVSFVVYLGAESPIDDCKLLNQVSYYFSKFVSKDIEDGRISADSIYPQDDASQSGDARTPEHQPIYSGLARTYKLYP